MNSTAASPGLIRRFTRHTLVYGLGNILNRAITFLLLPLYTNVLSPREYGVLNLIYPFLGIMNVLYMYGMDAAFMRFYIPEKDPQRRRTIFSTIYLSILVSTAVLSLIILSMSPLLIQALGEGAGGRLYVKLTIMILALDGLSFIPVLYYRSTQQPVRYVIIIFLEVLTNLSLNILLVAGWKWGIKGVLWANVLSSTIKLLVATPAFRGQLKLIWESRLWKSVLAFGLPTMPAVLFAMVATLGDRYILSHFFDKATVGYYSAGYKIGVLMALVVAAFRFAWHPFFLSIAGRPDAKQTYARILTLYLLTTGFLFLGVALLAPPVLIHSWGGFAIITKAYQPGLKVIPFILLAFIFQGLYVNLVVGMYIKKKTYLAPLFTGSAMVVDLGLNFLFFAVWRLDFYFAAVAFMAAQATQALLLYLASRRFYPIPYEGTKLLRIVVAAGVIYWLVSVSSLPWLVNLLLVLAYLPVAALLGVTEVRDIYYWITRKLFKPA